MLIGGDAIRITGTNFGETRVLKLGNEILHPVNYIEDEGTATLEFITPAGLPPGPVLACLFIDTYGCAVAIERYNVIFKTTYFIHFICNTNIWLYLIKLSVRKKKRVYTLNKNEHPSIYIFFVFWSTYSMSL